MLKKILIVLTICLFIVVCFFIWYFNNQSIKVTVVKESYSRLSTSSKATSLDIKLLVNQKNSYITNKDKVASCYIRSYKNDEVYKMNLIDIYLVNQTSINKDNYYIYNINLRFMADISEDIILKEAYLVLNYNNSKSLDIMIGSVYISKGELETKEVSLACMKAITSKIDNIITIDAIVFRFNAIKALTIKKITCLDANLTTQNASECSYDNTNDLNDLFNIFNTNYNYMDTRTKPFSIDINDTGEIVITLGYLYHYEINNFPIRIEYEVDGILKELYIDNFNFFTNNNRMVKYSDLTIYEFEYN